MEFDSAQIESIVNYFNINETDLNTIDTDIRQKLLIGTDNLFEDVKRWKNNVENSKVNQEQIVCEYEEKIRETTANLDQQSSELQKLKSDLTSLEDKLRTVSTDRDDLKEKYNEVSMSQIDLRKTVGNVESERDTLADLVRRHSDDLETVRAERDRLMKEADQVRRDKLEVQLKLDDLLTKESSCKHREERWNQDRKSIEEQRNWLEKELHNKTEQVLTSRRDMSAKLLNLETELQCRTNELTHSRQMEESLKTTIEKLSKSNENYLQKLKQSHDEHNKMVELYTNELQSQKRLIDLYKDKSTDADSKSEELVTAVKEMQNLLKVAAEDHVKLETEKQEILSVLETEKEDITVKVQQLERELQDANHLLEKFRAKGVSEEELKRMNPSAAVALDALKRGRTLTQIYTDYMQVVEERDTLLLEKQRLSDYIRELMEEMEDKAPSLKRQQEEFQRSQSAVGQLSGQLDTSMQQLLTYQTENEELSRTSAYYQRENKRYKQTCQDLSKQVRILLREVEIARGGRIEGTEDDGEVTSSSVVSAGDIISEHLLTFRSVCELQEKNQKLLAVSRDLGEKLEEREAQLQGERMEDLQTRMDELHEEVEKVRRCEQISRQQLDMTTRQRDMYKVLVDQANCHSSGHDLFTATTGMSCPSTPQKEGQTEPQPSPVMNFHPSPSANESMRRLEETCAALKEMQSDFHKYREDKAASDKIHSDTAQKLREDNSELRLLNAKMSSQMDFTHEKFKVLETNMINYKKEINVLRDMNQKYTSNIAKLECELANGRAELLSKVDRLSALEVQVRSLLSQNDNLRGSEGRLRGEVEESRRQQQTQRLLMHNLQAIQSNLEQRDSSERLQVVQRTETLQREVDSLRREMERERDTTKEQRLQWAADLQSSKKDLETERQSAEEALNEAVEKSKVRETELYAQIEKLRQQLASGGSVILAAGDTGGEQSESRQPADVDKVQILQLQLTDTERERDGLQQTVSRLTTQLTEYKDIAEGVEHRLEEEADKTRQLQTQLNTRLEDEVKRCEFLQSQITLQEKERQTLVNENIKTNEEAHDMNAELRRQLLQVQHDLQESIQRREVALSIESTAKAEIDRHVQMAREANDKYQRELILHAADAEALDNMKKEMTKLQSVRESSQEEIQTAVTARERAEKALTDYETSVAQLKADIEASNAELTQQNGDMQDQVVKLTSQIVSLRRLTEGSADVSISEEELKTSEQLLQLIKYLRRQKEIAEASMEMSTAENSRLSSLVSGLERQLADTRRSLEEERESSQLEVETAAQHAELLKNVEQLNLVTESNRLLRQERETLTRTVREAENRAETLKSSIEPLQEKLRVVTDERNSFEIDRKSLEEERNRWKERCNKLIESAERMDPEQYKKACTERDELTEKLSFSESKIRGLEGELSSRDRTIGSLTANIESLKETLADQETTSSDLIKKNQNLEANMQKRDGTIAQLRDIARKYKTEAESLKKETLQEGKLQDELRQARESLSEAQRKLSDSAAEVGNLTSQLNSANESLTNDRKVLEDLRRVSTADADTPLVEHITGLLAEQRSRETSLTNQNTRLQEEGEERKLRLQMMEPQMQRLVREITELRRLAAVSVPPSTQQTMTSLVPGPANASALCPTTGFVEMDAASGQGVMEEEPRPRSTPLPLACSAPTRSTAVAPPQQSVSPPSTLQQPQQQQVYPGGQGPRQTAEIRPMPSVATVMPTPAQELPGNEAGNAISSTAHLQMGPVIAVSVPVETAAVMDTPVSSSSGGVGMELSGSSNNGGGGMTSAVLVSSLGDAVPSSSLSASMGAGVADVNPVSPSNTTGLTTMRGGVGKRRREDTTSPAPSSAPLQSGMEPSSSGAASFLGGPSEAKRLRSVPVTSGEDESQDVSEEVELADEDVTEDDLEEDEEGVQDEEFVEDEEEDEEGEHFGEDEEEFESDMDDAEAEEVGAHEVIELSSSSEENAEDLGDSQEDFEDDGEDEEDDGPSEEGEIDDRGENSQDIPDVDSILPESLVEEFPEEGFVPMVNVGAIGYSSVDTEGYTKPKDQAVSESHTINPPMIVSTSSVSSPFTGEEGTAPSTSEATAGAARKVIKPIIWSDSTGSQSFADVSGSGSGTAVSGGAVGDGVQGGGATVSTTSPGIMHRKPVAKAWRGARAGKMGAGITHRGLMRGRRGSKPP